MVRRTHSFSEASGPAPLKESPVGVAPYSDEPRAVGENGAAVSVDLGYVAGGLKSVLFTSQPHTRL